MNNFTAEWLALREPVDHRSRNPKLLESVAAHLQHVESSRSGAIHIVDLGCGSGSNLRALAPVFNDVQEWTLVDSDPKLLLAAQAALLKWSEDSTIFKSELKRSAYEPLGTKLILKKYNKEIIVNFHCADLSKEVHLPIMATTDLVTAAAFFDLTSDDWLRKFRACFGQRWPTEWQWSRYQTVWTQRHWLCGSGLGPFEWCDARCR
jgi:SAM-dependent methyltransferase